MTLREFHKILGIDSNKFSEEALNTEIKHRIFNTLDEMLEHLYKEDYEAEELEVDEDIK